MVVEGIARSLRPDLELRLEIAGSFLVVDQCQLVVPGIFSVAQRLERERQGRMVGQVSISGNAIDTVYTKSSMLRTVPSSGCFIAIPNPP